MHRKSIARDIDRNVTVVDDKGRQQGFKVKRIAIAAPGVGVARNADAFGVRRRVFV